MHRTLWDADTLHTVWFAYDTCKQLNYEGWNTADTKLKSTLVNTHAKIEHVLLGRPWQVFIAKIIKSDWHKSQNQPFGFQHSSAFIGSDSLKGLQKKCAKQVYNLLKSGKYSKIEKARKSCPGNLHKVKFTMIYQVIYVLFWHKSTRFQIWVLNIECTSRYWL